MRLEQLMKKISLGLSLLLLSLGLSAPLTAKTSSTHTKSVSKQGIDAQTSADIKKEMSVKLNVKVISVAKAPIPGYYQLNTEQGILYLSLDRKHMIFGNVYSLDGKITNLTEQSQQSYRVEQLKAFEKNMIVFPAQKEKHVITVFTDVSCGYCKKLHSEIKSYNDKGITVRYLAFPRGGTSSQAFETMQKVWCSKDQRDAMTRAKSGQAIKSSQMAKRCDLEIKQQYELGGTFGINGTPAIILDDGQMLPGYVPADTLVKKLSSR